MLLFDGKTPNGWTRTGKAEWNVKDGAIALRLVGVLKADPAEILDGQWNRFDITAQGDHLVIVYNGKTILDGHDSKHASGKIGLQWATHSVTGKGIEFRNIKVKRMS